VAHFLGVPLYGKQLASTSRLDEAKKALQGQTLQLILTDCQFWRKKILKH
jgi:hypothetical protein